LQRGDAKLRQVGIFLISKNNYEFLDKYWAKNFNFDGFRVLNIDEGSSSEQRILGKKICKKYGIEYMDRCNPGLQNNVALACNYFKENNIRYLTWWQHDCWAVDSNFMNRLDRIIQNGSLSSFGTFGFNGIATDVTGNYKKDLKIIRKGGKPLGILGRGHLCGRSWYVGDSGRTKILPIPDTADFHIPFAVESIAWFAIGLNIDLFIEHIKVDGDYGFHLAWDDICFQFLNKNIYNVVLPDLYIQHRPDLKPSLGIPKNSAKYTRDSSNNFFFEQADHHHVWFNKWGWKWGERKTFNKVKGKYKSTLIDDFYNHDMSEGPLKTFVDILDD